VCGRLAVLGYDLHRVVLPPDLQAIPIAPLTLVDDEIVGFAEARERPVRGLT